MPRRLLNPVTAAALCSLAVLLITMPPAALAAERVTLSYTAAADGSCDGLLHTLVADWTYEAPGLDVDARVRTAPSAADCETSGLSYRVATARRFGALPGRGIDVLFRAAAMRQSVTGLYAEVDAAGAILRRADGRPAYVHARPAGSVESLEAALGLSWAVADSVRLDFAGHLVPFDWSDGTRGHAAHVGFHAGTALPWGRAELSATADIGRHALGSTRAEWVLPAVAGFALSTSVTHDVGLDALAADAAAFADVNGRPVALTGPPRGSATTLALGLSRSI